MVSPKLSEFFQAYEGRLPRSELELMVEAAHAAAFPDRPRLDQMALAGAELGGPWLAQAQAWAERRLRDGTPVQHLTREGHFFGRVFEVGPEVLIPRPETEVLVDAVVRGLANTPGAGSLRGAEVGAGSGAISITLLLEMLPSLRMVSTELESAARATARRNAQKWGVADRLSLVRAGKSDEVCEPLIEAALQGGGFDFLVSNPPYLKRDCSEVEPQVSRFEPEAALFAPIKDLLYFYREIAAKAGKFLRTGAPVWLELPHERAVEIRELFVMPEAGFEEVRLLPDLSGRDRVLAARFGILR